VILVAYLLGPLAAMLFVAWVAHPAVVAHARGTPARTAGMFLAVEAVLTVIVIALVQETVRLPDEERCGPDLGVMGSLSLVPILGTAAAAGVSLTGFVADARRSGIALWHLMAVAVAAVLPYVALAAIIYRFLTCLS
jgi:hypothetical protein